MNQTTTALAWVKSQSNKPGIRKKISANHEEVTTAILEKAQEGDITLAVMDELREKTNCTKEELTTVITLLTASKPRILEMILLDQDNQRIPLFQIKRILKSPKKAEKTTVVWRLVPQK